jgi:hypothetical protein
VTAEAAPHTAHTDRSQVVVPARPEPGICPQLAGIMAGETDGYAPLRGRAIAREQWRATAGLPGVEQCTLEGEAWPRARLTCASAAGGGRDQVLEHFDDLAAKIDACLARAFWFPRDWQRGELFEFAMDERQLAWVDQSSMPPSSVVLKVQQDVISRDYRLEVNFQTIR